jgi:hypothetical protein
VTPEEKREVWRREVGYLLPSYDAALDPQDVIDAAQRLLGVAHALAGVGCRRCDGRGYRAYGSSSTWRGGAGGQAITSDVCDQCWGSGRSDKPHGSLRRILQADAAAKAMLDQLREDTRRWRDSGLSLEAIRDLVNRWQSEDISFGKLVEELRLAASAAAADQAQSVLDGISRSLVAAVKGHEHYDAPPLHWSQALKLACDEIEDLRRQIKTRRR